MKITLRQLKAAIAAELKSALRESKTRRRSLSSIIFEDADAPPINWNSKYEEFVSALGANASDPKVMAFVKAGQLDDDANDDKFTFNEGASFPVSSLIPCQNEIDIDKSLDFPLQNIDDLVKYISSTGPFAPGGKIITYNGKYIVDGHHRWSQVYACNKNASISAVDIQIDGLQPLEVLKAVQAAIAVETGQVPTQSVEGNNLLKIDKSSFVKWLSSHRNIMNVAMKLNTIPDIHKILSESLRRRLSNLIREEQEKTKVKSKVKQKDTKDVFGAAADQKRPFQGDFGEQDQESLDATSDQLIEYLWSNVVSMQKNSQPVDGAPGRGFMPQPPKDDSWKKHLQNGTIDIVDPHADPADVKSAGAQGGSQQGKDKKAQNSGYHRDGVIVVERWQRLAGLIK